MAHCPLLHSKGCWYNLISPYPPSFMLWQVSSCIQETGLSRNQLEAALKDIRKGYGGSAGGVDTQRTIDTESGDENFEALLKYGVDLTANAARLDPVIGRDVEIRRVVQVLCRR